MTSNGKVLLWCDDPLLGKSIRHFLEGKVYEVVVCRNLDEVVTALRIDDFRLLVTDCPYPGSAYDLLRKKFPELELFCAAHRQPFDLTEIIHCLQKRHQQEEERLQLGKYELIPAKNCLRFKKQEQKIPPKEIQLLLLLVKNHPDTVSKELIAQKLWPGDTQDHSNSINVYINNLRKYFSVDSGVRIESEYHKGVRLQLEQ